MTLFVLSFMFLIIKKDSTEKINVIPLLWIAKNVSAPVVR